MPQTRPDILFIVLDTLRRDRLSIYGHGVETSPHFDAFAADSTLFERAVSAAQWTVPSHASMFTGLYPSTHQVTEASHRLSPAYPTLAETLRAGGYHTVGFCNNPLVGILNNDLQRGFTEFYNYAGAAPNRPHNLSSSRVRRALAQRWQRFARTVGNRFAHSDWLFRISMNPRLVPLWTRTINYKGHTQHSIDDLTRWLKARHDAGRTQSDQPLFAFLNLMGTHLPYHPPRAELERIAPHISRDRHAADFMRRFNADAGRWASPSDPPLSEWERAVIDAHYSAELANQDAHVGRLLAYLRQSGKLDDMLVIIVADHGEGHGDHDFFGHSFVVYQELVHVPLAIRYPARFPSGRRAPSTISTRRLFHTVLDVAGVDVPIPETEDQPAPAALSLAHATNGHRDAEGGLVFAEAFPPQTFINFIQHRRPELIERMALTQVRRGVYHDGHKLAVVGEDVEGLFDVSADPAETQDLAAAQGPVVAELKARLGQFVLDAEARRRDGIAAARISDAMARHLRALGYLE